MKQLFCFFIIFIISTALFAQYPEEEQGYYKNPVSTSAGIVFSDNYASKIYLQNKNGIAELVAAPGCGLYFQVAPQKDLIGFKYIDPNRLQRPAILNLKTKEISFLHPPVQKCGQVSFATDGSVAFTIDTRLIVKKDGTQASHELGYYSNYTVLSPSAEYAAFNNAEDQICIINLNNNNIQQISDGEYGYFSPQWSPHDRLLAYSTLGGFIKVYDRQSDYTYNIGEGFGPVWSPDSQYLIYYKKDIENLQLKGSDLYMSKWDGSEIIQLSTTPDVCEMDPSLAGNDKIIFHSFDKKQIISARIDFSKKELKWEKILYHEERKINMKFYETMLKSGKSTRMNIPYVHQVYDTPNYFNGHWACAPTASIMLIAYHNILPKWSTYCSSPSQHYNDWGNYVSGKYRFWKVYYNLAANDPNGNPGWGGYGYMWSYGSPNSRMESYYRYHNFDAHHLTYPGHTIAKNQINSGNPYTVCVGLTSSGHLVLGHGIGDEEHTLIFNDPYGNKNSYGYPSYDGKNVAYDWPGYNNGHQNLNTVYWAVRASYAPNYPEDSLIVDDLEFPDRFYMHNKNPARMNYYYDFKKGQYGHMWYTMTTPGLGQDTCYVEWHPNLPNETDYKVFAYIPYVQNAATAAFYQIYHKNGIDTVIIDQSLNPDSWVPLGTFPFEAGTNGYVYLGDGSTVANQRLVIDALKWSSGRINDIAVNRSIPVSDYYLKQNYPNPFNPETTIRFDLLKAEHVRLTVYNNNGEHIASLLDDQLTAGSYSVNFDGSNMSSGVYYYTLRSTNHVLTKSMLLIK